MKKTLKLFSLLLVMGMIFSCETAKDIKDAYDKGVAYVNPNDPYQNWGIGDKFIIERREATGYVVFDYSSLIGNEPKSGDDMLGYAKIETRMFQNDNEYNPILSYNINAGMLAGATLRVDSWQDEVIVASATEENILDNIFNYGFLEATYPNVNLKVLGDKAKVRFDYYPEGYERNSELRFTYFLEGDITNTIEVQNERIEVVGWDIQTPTGNDVRGERW